MSIENLKYYEESSIQFQNFSRSSLSMHSLSSGLQLYDNKTPFTEVMANARNVRPKKLILFYYRIREFITKFVY